MSLLPPECKLLWLEESHVPLRLGSRAILNDFLIIAHGFRLFVLKNKKGEKRKECRKWGCAALYGNLLATPWTQAVINVDLTLSLLFLCGESDSTLQHRWLCHIPQGKILPGGNSVMFCLASIDTK